MKILTLLIILATLALSRLMAQTASPEVKEMCRRADADVINIDADRYQALQPVEEEYLKALTQAEKAATTRNDASELTAIAKMRQQVEAPQAIASPSSLSTLLQKAHSDYLASKDKIDRQYEPRREQRYGELLRKLATYEKTLPADSPTRKEITTINKNIAAIPKWGAAPAPQAPPSSSKKPK